MSYLPYLVAAYALFVLVLLWDWLAARRQLRQALRQARTFRPRAPRPPTSAESTDLLR